MKFRILVCEDEPDIAELLSVLLTSRGYETRKAYTGGQCLSLYQEYEPHLVLLDVMLPDISGWEVLREIRKRGKEPVVMVTACRRLEDRVKGLSEGADDYIRKPFENDEVLARIEAVLRRCYYQEPSGEVQIDDVRKEVHVRDKPVSLSPKEYQLISLLTSEPEKVFSPEEIIAHLWSDNPYASAQDVQKYIYLLRKKIEEDPSNPRVIVTRRGFGYQLTV